jgi:putative transposase
MAILVEEHDRSVVSACKIAGLSLTASYRPPSQRVDAEGLIIRALTALIAQEGRGAFWKCGNRLRVMGYRWNHKRVYRVYTALKLNQVRRTKKRVLTRVKVPLHAVATLNDTWTMDFMGDTLYSARRYRMFTVIDEGNRVALAIEVDVSLPSERVVAVLDQLVTIHGAPRQFRCDNAPEFVAETLREWCTPRGIALAFIQPGKPNQNA